MIDVSEIKNVSVLKKMKGDLQDFIDNPLIAEIYRDKFPSDSYEEDLEDAGILIGMIESRLKSISKQIKITKPIKNPPCPLQG